MSLSAITRGDQGQRRTRVQEVHTLYTLHQGRPLPEGALQELYCPYSLVQLTFVSGPALLQHYPAPTLVRLAGESKTAVVFPSRNDYLYKFLALW